MQRFSSIAVLLATAASLVNAHFTLDSPQSFGFDEDKEGQVPCGGYTIQGATRSPWYYKNGPIQLDSHHDTATVNIRISYVDNPTKAEDFTALPALKENLALTGQGEFCFHADATKSPPTSGQALAAGTNATLLIEFISTVHGALYQCAAVTFVDDAAAGAGANLNCVDSLTATASSSPDHDDGDEDGHDHSSASASPAATGSSSSSSSGTASATTTTTAPGSASASPTNAAARRADAGAFVLLAAAAGLAALL
ncbi:unnamed protein product [Tilletia controversa]|uniref:Copper acquisition factor BIM1-like domain-containing protein n=3 Tax=Tilletia TaxID=13289 RepID=A0A8X7MQZ0_9BASI|nr:hypothetical protein CF328_g4992 [Tilletia controversa]KAE8197247.1 hypothetical protein CF335_g4665 [Tilletia laevis]KAE8263800.1 hypothetical protein A4X03_0g1412 [Tilletia caries]KAE8198735.1 hypothetical protein CF336_g1534 [Tilletia laevis]KAE8245813.1 hypothetical protein A4X06_0g5401 [Tilletia controversa]